MIKILSLQKFEVSIAFVYLLTGNSFGFLNIVECSISSQRIFLYSPGSSVFIFAGIVGV